MTLITVGQLIDKTWDHYRARIKELLSVTAWLLIIPILEIIGVAIFPDIGVIYGNLEPTNADMAAIMYYFLITLVVNPVISLWIFISLTRVIADQLDGKRVNVKKIMGESWRLFVPVLWVGILVGLMMLAAVLIGFGPGSLAFVLAAQFDGGLVRLLASLIGLAGFIVAMVLIARWSVYYAMAQYGVVLDKKRGTAALSWSRQLVQGRWWHVVALLVAPAVLFGLIALVIVLALSIGSELLISSAAGLNADVYGRLSSVSASVFPALTMVVFQPLFNIPIVLLYRSLKESKKTA